MKKEPPVIWSTVESVKARASLKRQRMPRLPQANDLRMLEEQAKQEINET